MTLIERWKEMDDSKIIKEMQMLFANFSSAIYLFTTDENSDRIYYCVDHGQNSEIEAYGKKPGVCLSEKIALENIKHILLEYTFLLIPFFRNDQPTVDLGVRLHRIIGIERDETGEEHTFKDAVFVFEKCNNQAGFCVTKVIPLR